MDESKHSRSLTMDTKSEPSFRVLYYGDTGAAVPFKWESQPGTPKHALFSDYSTLPPLTPPPSYLARSRLESCSNSKSHRGSSRRLKMVVLLSSLPRLVRSRTSHVSSSSSYFSSSSSYSSTCSEGGFSYTWARKTRPLMFSLMDREEEEEEEEVRMCFGGRFGSFKNAFFAVVGGRRRRSAFFS